MAKAARLTWTLPTIRVDGSALDATDIARIDVFDDRNPGGAIAQMGAATSFTTGTLDVGQHNFTIDVVDTQGHVSSLSNVATVTVPAVVAAPSPVTDLSAVLVDV